MVVPKKGYTSHYSRWYHFAQTLLREEWEPTEVEESENEEKRIVWNFSSSQLSLISLTSHCYCPSRAWNAPILADQYVRNVAFFISSMANEIMTSIEF